MGDVDSRTGFVSGFCLASLEKLEKTPEYVYALCLCLFYPELLSFLASQRGTVPFLRGSMFLFCGRRVGGEATVDSGPDRGNDGAPMYFVLSLFLLGTGDVMTKQDRH